MKPIRVGVVGLGMVAQIMHLPYLKDSEDFEIAAVCDVSRRLAERMAAHYGVPYACTNIDDMLEHGAVDAVFILTFNHCEIAKKAARAGKHIFCEKPVAFSVQEALEIKRAVDKAGTVFMIGYMKRYDQGFLMGLKHFRDMIKTRDVRMITVHDACFANDLAIRSMYRLIKCGDIPTEIITDGLDTMERRLRQAVGKDAPPHMISAYRLLLETGSHDVNVLRGAFGDPVRVLHTEIWPEGNWISTTLDYGGDLRCNLTVARTARNWPDEFITAYGLRNTVTVEFPNPFHKNAATVVRRTIMDGDATTDQTTKASHEEAFEAELRHFADCVRRGKTPLTSLDDGIADTKLMTAIVKAYRRK